MCWQGGVAVHPDLIGAIEGVSKAVGDRASLRDRQAPNAPTKVAPAQLVRSVLAVSGAANRPGAEIATPAASMAAIIDSVFDTSAYVVRNQEVVDTAGIDPKHSLLALLGRLHDENLHSDFVAALLDQRVSGDLATRFFVALFNRGHPKKEIRPQDVRFVSASRELRLDAIDVALTGEEKGARRIDVLAKSNAGTLVIENKIWTGESEGQTTDYFDTVGNRFASLPVSFILLSPTGMPAVCPHFSAVSYVELFTILRALRLEGGWTPKAEHLADAYLRGLVASFVGGAMATLQRTRESLKEGGYV